MEVQVTAKGGSNGPIDWEIDGQKPKQSSIEFPHRTGPHTIHFKLDDQTGRDLQFHSTEAFWADKNDEKRCPPRGGTTEQTRVVASGSDRLTVLNHNKGEPCTICYQLNFVDGDGRSEEVDPEFKNGGGST